MKSRADWIKNYLKPSKGDAGSLTMFAAALTVVLGFGSMVMWDSSKSEPDADDGSRWSQTRVAAQGFRASTARSPRPLGSYLLPKDAAVANKRGSPAREFARSSGPNKPFAPVTDAIGPGLQSRAPGGASGGSQGSSGAVTSVVAKAADAKPAGPSGRPVSVALRQGEARPFRSGRLALGAGRGFGNVRSGAVGSGMQAGIGGSSTGASWESSVSGPTAATTQNGVGNMTSGAPASTDLGGGAPFPGSGANGGNGLTSQDKPKDPPTASAAAISTRQALLSSDAGTLRSQVGLPAVRVLRNMVLAMSDASKPWTILGAAQTVSGAPGASSLSPSIDLVRQNSAGALVCLQALSDQPGMPEDPPAAEACHRTAETPIHAYEAWPPTLRTINQGAVAAALDGHPAWNLLDSGSQSLPADWSVTTRAVLQDLQDVVLWSHGVRLPSWQPTWEMDVQQAIIYLQIAAASWDNITAANATNLRKSLYLAEGSRNVAAGLASLDHAWPQMSGGGAGDKFAGGRNGADTAAPVNH